jgi:acyl-CoA synthetase (AMP-forming)/AMP-acid ligase II
MALGITTVISPTPWKAAEAIAILEREEITVAQGVPTQWALILDRPELSTADLSSLRVAGTGAAKMPASRVAQLREALKVPVIVRYTSTESSLGCGTRPGDPDEVVATTVGKPVSGVTLELVGASGPVTEPGEVGVVRLRSNAQMLGYLDRVVRGETTSAIAVDLDLSATAIDGEGFIVTSDLGRFDADGNVELVGRQHELFQRGGYNIYPAEVEEALRACPAIRDVCVLGAPDPVLGEIGVAVVVASDPAAPPQLTELRTFLDGMVADYKRPDAMVLVEALPVTAMMKVDRNALRDVVDAAAANRVASLG